MTENKRFTLEQHINEDDVLSSYVLIIDNNTSETYSDSMSSLKGICELLNALNEENQRLKHELLCKQLDKSPKKPINCKCYIDDEIPEWDILHLNEEDGWEHEQIRDRLHLKGIDCYSADIWFGNDMAFLIGVDPWKSDKVAKVLGLHREVIYTDGEHQFMILNLYQEKDLREIEEVKE